MTIQKLELTLAGAALGVEITGLDLSKEIDAPTFEKITDAWRDHLVLRFRGQNLSDEDLLAFSRRFGPLEKAPINPYGTVWVPENPEINVISNITTNDGKRIGSLGDGEASWHADMTYVDSPPKGCLLYSIEIPPEGGDTGFANMFTAYDALPDSTKVRISGLNCKHDASRNSVGQIRKGFKDAYDDVRDIPGALHPLVHIHPETGARALYLGRRANACVIGLSIEDSDTLLDELWAHIQNEEFSWHHQWRVGDVILWDNRFTLHRRDAFDPQSRRHMRRTQIGAS